MTNNQKIFSSFSLVMLLTALIVGLVASLAYLFPEFYNRFLPFYQLRPMHVSAALFWILSGAVSCILVFSPSVFGAMSRRGERLFTFMWIGTIIAIFISYAFRKFGGREYWEFPPVLGVPLLAAWIILMVSYFQRWRKREQKPPLYVWMWTTGIVFFLITFLEQNVYQIPWFRATFLREITVQWKSNGSMVGAWNQMIYGTSLLIMVRISGDKSIAQTKKAFFFYFLGLTNLMFNWGHHIYNVPTASWIRHVSYAITMTEWLIFINIIRGFKSKLSEERKFRHLISYRFLSASEYWVFANLTLALFMSIPAINRYTHGTHITVAHAMGTTIGINTMILLAAFSQMLKIDEAALSVKRSVSHAFRLANLSLSVFWLALIVAGVLKGYRSVALEMTDFQKMMQPVNQVLGVFSFAGAFLLVALGWIAILFLKKCWQSEEAATYPQPDWEMIIADTEQRLEKEKMESL